MTISYKQRCLALEAQLATALGKLLAFEQRWQPIKSAPKGGGAEFVTDPAYVKPPQILVQCKDGTITIVAWDAYYAPGGNGHMVDEGFSFPHAWTGCEGMPVDSAPLYWMPLPAKHT